MGHPVHLLALLVGLVVIFFGLIVLRAAMRQFGQGSCLTGCCLWELADSILELGCGLVGCGGLLALAALPFLAWIGWLHP